jgi:DNA gyrase subunit A
MSVMDPSWPATSTTRQRGRTARGSSAVNIINLDDGEEITAVVNTDDFGDDEFITMVTRNGKVNRTNAKAFEKVLSTGNIAITLEEGDELADVEITDGNKDLFIATSSGRVIRFPEGEIKPTGRQTIGLQGLEFHLDDEYVSGLVATGNGTNHSILTVTEDGFGKRTPIDYYRPYRRRSTGFTDIKLSNIEDLVASIKVVENNEVLVAMTKNGAIMLTTVDEIPLFGRATPGVTIIDTEDSDRLTSVDVAASIEESPDDSDQ